MKIVSVLLSLFLTTVAYAQVRCELGGTNNLTNTCVDDSVLVGDGTSVNEVSLLTCSAAQKLQYNVSTNSFTCPADDDIPESGDFGAATDLDSSGVVTNVQCTASCISGSEIVDGTIAQVDIDDTNTLTTDQLGANNCFWATTGLMCEGATDLDGFGTLIAVEDPTADRTFTIPNETGTACTTGSVCTGYQGTVTAGNNLTLTGTDIDFDGIQLSNAGTDQGVFSSIEFGSDFAVTTATACVGGADHGKACTGEPAQGSCAAGGLCTADKQIQVAASAQLQNHAVTASNLPSSGVRTCSVITFGPTNVGVSNYCYGAGCNTTSSLPGTPAAFSTTFSDLRCAAWHDMISGVSLTFTMQSQLLSTCPPATDSAVNTCSAVDSSLTCTITGGAAQTEAEMSCSDGINTMAVGAGDLYRLHLFRSTGADWVQCSVQACYDTP